jgi:transposase-like protein
MAGRRHNYTREFKLTIFAQIETGLSVSQVARENDHPILVSRPKQDLKENAKEAFLGPSYSHKIQTKLAISWRLLGAQELQLGPKNT